MTRALVVGNAPLPPGTILRPLARGARIVVAADGGLDRARAARIRVDWLVGDLDSVTPRSLARFPKHRIHIDPDPERTDFEKALRFLARQSVSHVRAVGVLGGRVDHALAALSLLVRWGATFDLRLVDDTFETRLVQGRTRFRAAPGTVVSLMAPAGASGVSTRGLRWPLSDERLAFSPRGVHNVVVGGPVEIKVRRGPLLAMVSHRVWRDGIPGGTRRRRRQTAGHG